MITFTELLERTKDEVIAVHTPTEDEAKALLAKLDKRGYEWVSGNKLTDMTNYEVQKEKTCYVLRTSIHSIFNTVTFCPIQLCRERNYEIVEFTYIDFEEEK